MVMLRLIAVLFLLVPLVLGSPGILKDIQGYDGQLAVDPVLLSNITIDVKNSVHLAVHGGQKLFFETEGSRDAFKLNPRAYWMTPHDEYSSPKGMPDVRDSKMLCPSSGEEMVIDMSTPRIIMRNGQALYFCCWGCLSSFWNDPNSFFEEY